MGQYTRAVDTLRIGLRLNLDHVPSLQAAAWILATHPDPEKRDFNVALELAQKALQLTKREDARVLDALAAVYAASGRFEMAVKIAEAALAQATDEPELVQKIKARLALYRQKKPYVSRAPRRVRR